MPAEPDSTWRIRSFAPGDATACSRLYLDGLIGGSKISDNDTGLDIDDIQAVYMKNAGNHFWVAESAAGNVIGMIGVQHHDEGVGEIRRLRVSENHRRKGVGSALLEQALRFCQERQYLKITLDTYMDREPAVKLFEKFRFRHYRTRNVAGKELLYFYLDLYTGQERRASRTRSPRTPEASGLFRLAPPMINELEHKLFYDGIRLFNAHQFFEAHEVWEDAWHMALGLKHDFYQGLIQCAVALEHYRRSNPRGVASLYRTYQLKFAKLPPIFMGLDIPTWLAAMREVLRPILDAPALPEKGSVQLDLTRVPHLALTYDPFETGEAAEYGTA